MSTPKKKSKGTDLLDNLLGGERRRHQVAMITEEGDWNQHESNSGMARVFVVMLLVHVVLIGSIIVYDFIGTEETQSAPAPVVSKTQTTDPHELSSTPVKSTLPEATTSAIASSSEIPASGEYEVKSGDSLPTIAASQGVDVKELIALNHLEDGNIELNPLTILKLPARKVAEPAQVAVVKEFPPMPEAGSGTPEVAAAKVIPIEQTPPAPMPAVVSLADNQPSIDSTPAPAGPAMASTPPAPAPAPVAEPAEPEPVKLVAPKPAPAPVAIAEKKPAPKAEPKPAAKTTSSGSRSHTMAKGDTLYGLARKYGVSAAAIQKANNITKPESIRDGAKLIIPAK
jgi:LysM repeat protein